MARTGWYRGRDAVANLFAAVLSRSDDTLRVVEIDDVLVSDRHACALILVEARHLDRYIRTTDAIVFVLRAGRIMRGRVLSENQTEVDAFWD